jgi:2-desacetyl-2-hydroxyethyl bacteriochlorophyllide A dehydrogenase
MKALVYTGPECVVMMDMPSPSISPGEVLLKIHASGICGSDIHGYLGHSERRKPGLILGHEAVASIDKVHASVTGWRAGQRVVINPLQTCGGCPACQSGKQNLCAHWKVLGLDRVHGTYAEFISVPASCLYPVSDSISEAEAIMTEPLANVVHFFRTTMSEVPDSLTILGAGAIGVLALSMAKLRGIARVCVVDKNEGRLEVARQLKADHLVSSATGDPVKAVRDWSRGGTEFVIETAGIAKTRRQAVDLCRRGGRILFIGMAEMESSLPWIEMIRDEKAVFTTFCYTPRDFQTSLELIESRRLDLRPWTETRPLSDGQAGFQKMAKDPGSTIKMMFKI